MESSVALQHGQQWIAAWLSHLHQLLKNAYSEEYNERLRDIGFNMHLWIQRMWEQVQFQYYSIHFNTRALYRQMGNICFTDGTHSF